ncbi:PP2C family protein-serine/threonine phosphatase [Vallicoccus soli]|uniref:PP2C family protein-serine/threonine phosphatase n=1 Tax=Vallicoccus soli TaxID=2339232 RepID=UPI001403B0E3|nr:GAF domain-containing SpoIIE family protein phosphatase [Vallicoccus soli]
MATDEGPAAAASAPSAPSPPPAPGAADPQLDRVAALAARVLDAPVGLVSLLEGEVELLPGVAGLPEPWATTRTVAREHAICRHVVAGGRALAVPDAREHPLMSGSRAVQALGLVGYLGLPVTDDHGRVLGAVCVGDRRRRDWTPEETALLADLTSLGADRVRLVALRTAADALRRGDAAGRVLQRSLLTELPAHPLPGVALAVDYRPAQGSLQVGGDWYDAFPLPDGRLALVVGDVVGHDVEAAAVMGQMRSLLRGAAYHPHDRPSQVLERLDTSSTGLGLDTLATCVYAELDVTGAAPELHLSNAGHPPPLLVRSDGSCAFLAARDTDVLLGLGRGRRQDLGVPLGPGDRVLLYSDGLVEARDRTLDEGLARLLRAAPAGARGPLAAWVRGVAGRLLAPQPVDDAVLLAVGLERPAGAR